MSAVVAFTREQGHIETEYALIAALLFDARRIDGVADILAPECFLEAFYGRLYGLIVREHAKGNSLNALTLRAFIIDDPAFEEAGGNQFLANITSSALLTDTQGAARQVIDLANRRRLTIGFQEAISLAANSSIELSEIIDSAEVAILESTSTGDTIHQPNAGECIDEVLRGFDEPFSGVECGCIKPIDDILGSMRPKQLIIGAGRPGMGKTAAALSYAIGAARKGHGVLFVTLEMSSKELGARMAADMCFDGYSGVPYEGIRDNSLTDPQRKALIRARNEARKLPLQIIDTGKLTIGRLGMLTRRWRRRFEARGKSLDLVIVDYLQLLTPDERRKSNYEAVSLVSIGLKSLAKDQSVAVFALAQLSREVEKRTDKRPILSDLRDSGQIEQDADAVLFLYRHEYYLRQQEPDQRKEPEKHASWHGALRECEGRIEFICAKRRNGRTGSALGLFHAGNQAVRG